MGRLDLHLIRLITLITAILSLSATASAEYRVFELTITSESGQTRTVQSTLDHLQYSSYHPVKKDEKVEIAATWMCWTRSDVSQDPAQRYCPNPHPGGARAPASTAPKAPAKPSP
jgi:hypothetical protein